jgi:DNA-binding LytR/AlgR family response regulator
MKIVIIEDEKLTAKDLAKTIQAVEPDAEIIATLVSVEEAISYFKTPIEIDLIFSDIQLGDGMSFEIFEKIESQAPVIFCTAFDEYALDAFKTVGIDYLLKPFTKASVSKALEKYHFIKEKFSSKNDLSSVLNIIKTQLQPNKNPSVIIQQGDKIIPLDGSNIAFFFIEDTYVFAYTFNQQKHILNQRLDILERNFSPNFFRANRQFLVNRKAVKDASYHFHRKMVINLTVPFKEQIVIGKLRTTPFMEWLTEN